jgi:hypothetical protein
VGADRPAGRGRALGGSAWAGARPHGAPRARVAQGKHAQCPTRRAGDRGERSNDGCDRITDRVRFPLLDAGRNAESRPRLAAPRGCVPAARLALGAGPDARECVCDASAPRSPAAGAGSGPPLTPGAVALARAAVF